MIIDSYHTCKFTGINLSTLQALSLDYAIAFNCNCGDHFRGVVGTGGISEAQLSMFLPHSFCLLMYDF